LEIEIFCTHKIYLRKEFNKNLCYVHWYQLKYIGDIQHTNDIYDLKRFEFKDDICEIIIYDKYHSEKCRAIIDSIDYEKIKDYKWWVDNRGYIKADCGDNNKIRLHWLICGFESDHIDNNPLNNRRCNLRQATQSQNMMNQSKSTANTSGVKGVYWYKPQTTWKAQIKLNGKDIFLGYSNIFDNAVKLRISEEAKLFQERSNIHNKITNTLQLSYLSKDDNFQTFVESDLQGNIIKFEKLS